MLPKGVIFEVTDPRERVVMCTEERWKHVVDHAELANQQDAVRLSVASPLAIYQSATYRNREVYYRPSLMLPNPFDRGYIVVIVEFTFGNNGSVITAFHTFRPKAGEVLLWP